MPPFTTKDVIDQTNLYRTQKGLKPLSADPQLQKAAEARATDMGVTGNFSHKVATTSPRKHAWAFMQEAGYPMEKGGENLAVDFNTATDTMSAWQKSKTHNANLVDDYSDIGVAIVPGKFQGRDTYFVVQLFGNKKQQKEQIKEAIKTVNKPQATTKKKEIPTSDGKLLVRPQPMQLDTRMAKSTPAYKL